MFTFDDKTVFVTGASRGIGREIALRFGEAGAAVGVNHLPTEEARTDATEVVETISGSDGEAVAVAGDVSKIEDVKAMVAKMKSTLEIPDILVNNAGIHSATPLTEMSIETWDETLRVNLRGTFLVTRYFAPDMLRNGSGKIVNMASQHGKMGTPNMAHYSASKGGVIAFTQAIARELAPELHVNAIAPGPIETDMLGDLSDEERMQRTSTIPLERLGSIDDIVPTVLFLASDGSDFYTGQTFVPNGGEYMY